MKFAISLILVLLLSGCQAVSRQAQPETNAYEAPFGFRWGMSIEQVESMVGSFVAHQAIPGRPGQSVAVFEKAPKTPARTNLFSALFSSKQGLVKIVWSSTRVTGDVYGLEGKALYIQIKEIIKDEYISGHSEETKITGLKIYNQNDEFYQCLKYAGCGMWNLIHKPASGGYIAVELKGVERGVGYVSVSYESPQFRAASDAAIERGAAEDKKAF